MILIAPPKKSFNNYVIVNDYAIIYLEKRSGEVFQTYVDAEDILRLIKVNYHWHLIYDKKLETHYVKTTLTSRGDEGKRKQTTLYLHKFLLNIEGRKPYIDHLDHDTLNNRKSNLRPVGQSLNKLNPTRIRKNNTSGEPNVSWSISSNVWLVQLSINGKNICFGRFKKDEYGEAVKLARDLRMKYYKPLLEL